MAKTNWFSLVFMYYVAKVILCDIKETIHFSLQTTLKRGFSMLSTIENIRLKSIVILSTQILCYFALLVTSQICHATWLLSSTHNIYPFGLFTFHAVHGNSIAQD